VLVLLVNDLTLTAVLKGFSNPRKSMKIARLRLNSKREPKIYYVVVEITSLCPFTRHAYYDY